MSFYRDVTSKPWLSQGLPRDALAKPAFNVPNEKVALSLFIASATVLFSLLVVSYYMRMGLGDWVAVNLPALLWLNTATLVLSSVAFQLATRNGRRESATLKSVHRPFVIGGILALLFIAGQYLVWHQLSALGYHVADNPANGFFYLLTGVHVLHLLGGLWVWSKALLAFQRAEEPGETKLSVELCTTYWHFLLLVWLGLLYLLAVT